MKKLALTLALLVSSAAPTLALAAGSTAKAAPAAPAAAAEVTNENFRCERIRDAKLPEFKTKLMENCDLNRPFSMAMTDVALGNSFTYCCHLKAQ